MKIKRKPATDSTPTKILQPAKPKPKEYTSDFLPPVEVAVKNEIEVIRKLENWGIIPPLKQRNDIY